MYQHLLRTLNVIGLVSALSLAACSNSMKSATQTSNVASESTDPGVQQPSSPNPSPMPAPAPTTGPLPAPVGPNCGLQLATSQASYCETFDKPFPIVGGSGQMDQRLWGVSRGSPQMNLGYGWPWGNAVSNVCGGIASTNYMTDIQVCNGRMYETTNDHVLGEGAVVGLTMYPKQPFDFSGRVGTVGFDVTNDSTGSHSAWPEFWMTDQPYPLPITHFSSSSAPANGFGIRFSAVLQGGQGGCANGDNDNLDSDRFTVESIAVVRDWFMEDVGSTPCDFGNEGKTITCVKTGMTLEVLGCVKQPTGPNDAMNHIEIKVSKDQIDVYGTDPGSKVLKHLAVAKKTNLSLTRGFIWIEDKHYNANKGPDNRPKQAIHTFAWDNIAFDGPLIARDLAFEVPGPMDSVLGGNKIGFSTGVNQGPTVSTLPMGAADIVAAKTVSLLFTFWYIGEQRPTTFTYTINGHVHNAAWPFPDTMGQSQRTISLPVPVTDLVMGPNQIKITADKPMEIANISLSLNGAAGIVKPEL